MTRRVGDAVILEVTPPAKCELCGKMAELRPYGPNGEQICFQCGKNNPEATRRAMAQMFGVEP